MNKILMRLCLPLALTAALTACGNDDAPSSDSGANVVVAPSNEPTEAASEAPAPTATDESGSGGGSGSGEVSEADARGTALTAAGAGATVRELERDDEDGRPVDKFKVAGGSTERKISVDRATGQIVKDETDSNNDTDTDNDTDSDTDD